jgi:RNA polymerase sigma-70 factor, ECF subfamily
MSYIALQWPLLREACISRLQLFPRDCVLVINEPTSVQTQPTGPSSTEFITFMRAYQDMVFSTAARLSGNDTQAQDIAQEVFLKAYEQFAQLRTSPTAGGWLKTVTTNLTLNYLTRHRRRWRLFSELPEGDFRDADAPGPEWEVQDTLLIDLGAEQRRLLVDAALRQLPQHQRLPLVLYHFEDMPYQDIAEKLGVSLTKVKTDIRRGRAALLPLLGAAGLLREGL